MRFVTSDPRVVGFLAESLTDSEDSGLSVSIEITDDGRLILDGFDVLAAVEDDD